MANLLIIDSDKDDLQLTAKLVKGFFTDAVSTPDEGVAQLKKGQFDYCFVEFVEEYIEHPFFEEAKKVQPWLKVYWIVEKEKVDRYNELDVNNKNELFVKPIYVDIIEGLTEADLLSQAEIDELLNNT